MMSYMMNWINQMNMNNYIDQMNKILNKSDELDE